MTGDLPASGRKSGTSSGRRPDRQGGRQMKFKRSLLAVAGVAALAVPAAALARSGHGHGHSPNHGKNHPVAYVFKGTYEGDGVVSVNHGNAHVRHADLIGDVTFDLSAARLSVADTNADTVIDPTDVLVGDHVVV